MPITPSKKITILFFLFALFILAAVLVGTWLVNIYRTGTGFTDSESRSLLECNRYTYEISDFEYKDGVLSFTIDNISGLEMDNIVVESGGVKKRLDFPTLLSGNSQELSVELELSSSFRIYPEGCENNNFKEFRVK